MNFHLRHMVVGFTLILVFQGGMNLFYKLPDGFGFLVSFFSIFTFSIFLYKMFVVLSIDELIKSDTSHKEMDKIVEYYRRGKLSSKAQLMVYVETIATLLVYFLAFLADFKLEGTVGGSLMDIGISISILGCSYMYFNVRRRILSTFLHSELHYE